MYWICSIGFVSYFFDERVLGVLSGWIVHFLARGGLNGKWRVATVALCSVALGFLLILVL